MNVNNNKADDKYSKKGSFSFQDFLDNSFKNFDIYTKIDEDYRVQTSNGGILSIVGWVVIAILCLGEFRNYMRPVIKEHMTVDKTFGQQLQININISFHALTCAQVHVDAMDIAGDNQINVEQTMFKQRLSSSGRFIGDKSNEGVGKNRMKSVRPTDCGSCFGAESPHRRCCNTCDDLKQAYDELNWNVQTVIDQAEPCIREKNNPIYQAVKGEGCQVSGYLKVNKVGGNFHIAHGDSIVRDGRHIHMFNPLDAPNFNVSHTIHSVSFGAAYPRMPANPLDKEKRLVPSEVGTGLFQYYIKVIPTVYRDSWGYGMLTHQYTFTEKFKAFEMPKMNERGQLIPTMNMVLPGMFFIYELSPFMIEVTHETMPLSHFLAKVCAIVGGIFTVLGVVDSFLYRLASVLRRKLK